jgi:hypothetical protein
MIIVFLVVGIVGGLVVGSGSDHESDRSLNLALATPTNIYIDSKSGWLSWSSVQDAQGYKVVIDLGNIYGDTDREYSVDEVKWNIASMIGAVQGQTYSLRVQAISGKDGISNSGLSEVAVYTVPTEGNGGGGETLPPTKSPLTRPTLTLDKINKKISWQHIPNTYQYILEQSKTSISGNQSSVDTTHNISNTVTSWDIDDDNDTMFVFSLRAKADPDSSVYSDSEWSAAVVYTPDNTPVPELPQLATPIVSLQGTNVAWLAVQDAISYQIEIDSIRHNVDSNTYTYSLSNLTTDSSIRVRAVANNVTHISSEWSNTVMYSPQVPQLSTPLIQLSSSTVSWSAISNAESYTIDINGSMANIGNVTQCSLGNLPTGTYQVRVKATASGYKDSQWSNILTYSPQAPSLTAPTISVLSGILRWSAVPNATAYTLDIDGVANNIGSATQYALDKLTDNKTYVLRLKATASGYKDSQWSNIVNYLPGGGVISGDTSPDAVESRIGQFVSKQQWDTLFPWRWGMANWRSDTATGGYYRQDTIQNAPDFFSYDNFVKAARIAASVIYIVEMRENGPGDLAGYEDARRYAVIDKTTGIETEIVRGPDFDASWNTSKPVYRREIDYGRFLLDGSDNDKKRELAAFFAHSSHETGGKNWGAAEETTGLYWNEEVGYIGAQTPGAPNYQGDNFAPGYVKYEDKTFPPTPGKSYHGRGPFQLSWNYNYGPFSALFLGDSSILLDNPEMVTQDGSLAWLTALWFWMTPSYPKASMHEVMTGNIDWMRKGDDAKYTPGFGLTIIIINGGLEGNLTEADGRIHSRILFYRHYAVYTGADITGEKLDTAGMYGWT